MQKKLIMQYTTPFRTKCSKLAEQKQQNHKAWYYSVALCDF